jgi:hypothetical protein
MMLNKKKQFLDEKGSCKILLPKKLGMFFSTENAYSYNLLQADLATLLVVRKKYSN